MGLDHRLTWALRCRRPLKFMDYAVEEARTYQIAPAFNEVGVVTTMLVGLSGWLEAFPRLVACHNCIVVTVPTVEHVNKTFDTRLTLIALSSSDYLSAFLFP